MPLKTKKEIKSAIKSACSKVGSVMSWWNVIKTCWVLCRWSKCEYGREEWCCVIVKAESSPSHRLSLYGTQAWIIPIEATKTRVLLCSLSMIVYIWYGRLTTSVQRAKENSRWLEKNLKQESTHQHQWRVPDGLPHEDMAMRVFLQRKKDGHLAEDHGQYAAVYTRMENLVATSSNADISGWAKKIHKQLKDFVFTAFCHFVSDLFGGLALLSLKLQANNLILSVTIVSIKDCMETVKSMNEEYIPGGMYEKFILCTEEQQSENLQGNPKFQGVEMTGSPICEVKEKLKKHVGSIVDITIKELESRFQNLLGMNTSVDTQGVVKSFIKVFNHDRWPECKKEFIHFGNKWNWHYLWQVWKTSCGCRMQYGSCADGMETYEILCC